MNLNPTDLHLEFDAGARLLTVWDASHQKVMECEARNKTTNDGQLGHYGNCPSGLYLLGPPAVKNTVPFGPFFIAVIDFGPNTVMADHGRAGIGIHGGGSGLTDPFAARQGWQVTHGCIRLQNIDLRELVHRTMAAQQGSGKCYLTVTAILPGAAANEPDDWGPPAPIEEDE